MSESTEMPRALFSIRTKLLVFASLVALAFSGGSWMVQRWIVQPEFDRIELRDSEQNLERVVEAIARDAETLSRAAQDYAAWDETLDFVRVPNQKYLDSNLIPETLTNANTDFAIILGPQGELLFAEFLAESGTDFAEDPAFVDALLGDQPSIFEHASPTSRNTGVASTRRGLVVLGSSAITDNEQSVPPSGTFLFGRFLDAGEIAELAARTRVALSLIPLDAIGSADRPAADALARGARLWRDAADAETLVVYSAMRDASGRDALLVRLELPRTTSLQAAAAAELSALVSTGASLGLLGVMWLVLARFVVKPIERVTRHAVRVGSSGDLGVHLDLDARDEIGVLAREFDAMVVRLDASRMELLDLAHRAGRSQIARTVLHDIGNVLNNVQVASNVLADGLERSELPNLGRVVGLLRENADRLPSYLETDPRGRHVLSFLEELDGTLGQEREQALRELKSLLAGVDHMAALVRSQNREADTKPALELLEPGVVAAQAAALTSESFDRHGIEFEGRYAPLPRMPLDRHRCLQVLANLLTNAKHAIVETGRGRGHIGLTVAETKDEAGAWIEFSVVDDGIGIAEELRERIFSLGFSTRASGQGIGLHSAANLAREMGGSLAATSDGPNQGATFTLRIPGARSDA